MSDLDLINRDPNNINDHIKVAFEDVLAEPEGIQSIDCVWKLSYTCFNFSKNFCYKLMTLCCGICVAFAWGCDFAMVAYTHVWFYTPCIRDFTICLGCFQRVYGTIVLSCCGPCCETYGMMFSKIKIQKT